MIGLDGIAMALIGLAIMLACPLHRVLTWHTYRQQGVSRLLHTAYPAEKDDGSNDDLLDKIQ